MIAGRQEPALGGEEAWLDVLGVNFYPRNQWVYRGRRLRGPVLRPGDPLHRPLASILAAVHARYGRPLFVAETGCEGDERPAWLAGVAGEVRRARAAGRSAAPGWTGRSPFRRARTAPRCRRAGRG